MSTLTIEPPCSGRGESLHSVSVPRQVGERRGLSLPVAELRQHAEPVPRTTRGEPIGEPRATGAPRFH